MIKFYMNSNTKSAALILSALIILIHSVLVIYSLYSEHKILHKYKSTESLENDTDYSFFKYNSWNFYQHIKNYTKHTMIALLIIIFLMPRGAIYETTIIRNGTMITNSGPILSYSMLMFMAFSQWITSRLLFHCRLFISLASLMQVGIIYTILSMIFVPIFRALA